MPLLPLSAQIALVNARFISFAALFFWLGIVLSVGAQDLQLVIPEGHKSRITSVSYHPNGKIVASASEEGQVKIWGVGSGREIRTLKNELRVNSIDFSPDGTSLVAAMGGNEPKDGTFGIWNIEDGTLIQKAGSYYVSPYHTASYQANGKFVVFAAGSGVSVFYPEEGRERVFGTNTFRQSSTCAAAINERFFVAVGAQGMLKLYDRFVDMPVHETSIHQDQVTSLIVSRNGSKIITGSRDGQIRVWRVTGLKDSRPEISQIESINAHPLGVQSLAFSPDNTNFASGGVDGELKIWEMGSWKNVISLSGHDALVTSLEYSPDGELLLTGSYDKTIRLWDIRNGLEIKKFGSKPLKFSAAAANSDEGFALGNLDGSIKVWNPNGQGMSILRGHSKRVRDLVYGSTNDLLASSSDDLTAKLWNVRTSNSLQTFVGHGAPVIALALSSNDSLLITGAMDNLVKVWNASDGQELLSLRGHSSWVNSVAISSDSRYVASGSRDRTVRLWDIQKGEVVKILDGFPERVFADHLGRLITHRKINHELQIIDIITEEVLKVVNGSFNSTGISPTLKYIIDFQCPAELRLTKIDSGDGFSFPSLQTSDCLLGLSIMRDEKRILLIDNFSASIWDINEQKLGLRLYQFGPSEWAARNESGLFDASPGAMTELYFVKGLETIDLHQLKHRFYEPGLVDKVLGVNKEPLRNSRGLNTIQLFPSIQLGHPHLNQGDLVIKLKDQGGGIGRVQVFINSKEALEDAREASYQVQNDTMLIKLTLEDHPYVKPGEVNTVEVVAFNGDEYLSSPPQTILYSAAGQKQTPNLYAVIVGASDYKGRAIDLKYASSDAIKIQGALQIAGANFFGQERMALSVLTTDEKSLWPTKENIIKTFENISSTARPNDVLVVYLAGHGINYGGAEGDFYFLTADAASGDLADPVIRQNVAISSQEFTGLIKGVPALKQVLIIDACHAGTLAEDLLASRQSKSSGEIRALERLKDRTGMYVLAGSAADAVSYEASVYGQGILTYSLLLGIKGAALRENKYIDVMNLFQFSADEVPKLAANIGGIQKPEVRVPFGGQSFDIGMVSEEDKLRIQLERPKPLFLRSSFENETTFYDDLALSNAVDDRLRNMEDRGTGQIVFLDAMVFEDGYSLKGRYLEKAGVYEVHVRLFKGDNLMIDFIVSGENLAELTNSIIEKVVSSGFVVSK